MKRETPTGTPQNDAMARMMLAGVINDTGSRAATPGDWPKQSIVWAAGREGARPAEQAAPVSPVPAEGVLYTLAEACERHRVSYSTMTQAMSVDKRLYEFGVPIGAGTERRTRLYCDADFMAMLRARQTMRGHRPRKIRSANKRNKVQLSSVRGGRER